jgi:hypothetical protein
MGSSVRSVYRGGERLRGKREGKEQLSLDRKVVAAHRQIAGYHS